MSLHSITTISLNGLTINTFESLNITQDIEGHHSFDVVISLERLKEAGKTLFDQVKDLIGKEAIIEIKPELPEQNSKELLFKGLVTNILTGKSLNGIQGFCTIKGFSPTILLDDDPNIKIFEGKTLQSIADEIIKKYPKNLLNFSASPKFTDTLKYTVQYKENSWHYLRRLASTYGEWFFYQGSKLIFGKATSEKVSLSHLKDLLSFNLNVGIRSSNIVYHAYEYRSDKPIEVDTKSQETGRLNTISDHILKVSDSLYTNQSLFKVNHATSGKAQQEIKHVALMQRKSRIADMVHASGESTNLGVQIGCTIEIKEDLHAEANHGEFFVTNVSHYCDGDGNYSNHFSSIPADTAAPAYHPEYQPRCEAQSAIVMENHDPKGLGRVKVKFQWQKQGMSPWLRLLSASGGSEKGFYFVPEKGEEVWVDFEGGNPELPFVAGTKFNGNAKTGFGNADNDIKTIKTRSGHTIELDDKNGEEKITIKDKNGNMILLDTSKKGITIVAPEELVFSAKNIKMSAEENIEIGAKKKIQVAAEQDIDVIASGKLAMQAQKDITAKSKTGGVTLEAMKDATISGQNVTAEGKIKATVTGVQTKISGKMTAVQGASGKIDIM